MLAITPHERRALRARAHHLHPVVTIGQQGLTPTVLTEIDLALNAHGLIKVRVFIDERDEREALLAEIADGLEAAAVQHIGKLFVLWRPPPETEPEPPAARRPRAKPGTLQKATPHERPRPRAKGTEPVRRRARGTVAAGKVGLDGDGQEQRRGAASLRGSPRGPSAPNPRRRRGPR